MAADGLVSFEDAAGPVARCQPTDRVLTEDDFCRAQHAGAVGIRFGELLGAPLGQRVEALAVEDLGPVFAAHCDRFQILAGHDRAHAGATVSPVSHADQRRVADAVFAGDARLQHLDLGVAQFILEDVLDDVGGLAPEMLGRP